MDKTTLLWLLLGTGFGMTLGRSRAERLRARRDMSGTWANRDNYRGFKKWKLIRR